MSSINFVGHLHTIMEKQSGNDPVYSVRSMHEGLRKLGHQLRDALKVWMQGLWHDCLQGCGCRGCGMTACYCLPACITATVPSLYCCIHCTPIVPPLHLYPTGGLVQMHLPACAITQQSPTNSGNDDNSH